MRSVIRNITQPAQVFRCPGLTLAARTCYRKINQVGLTGCKCGYDEVRVNRSHLVLSPQPAHRQVRR